MVKVFSRFRPIDLMFAALILAALVMSFTVSAQDPNTPIQEWLKNPWVLLGLMVFGSILSMLKQWGTAKMEPGVTPSFASYLSHLPEFVTTLGGNLLAFLLLADSGNLNFLSAVSIGYVINSAADLNPMGSRSTALK